MEKQFRTIIMLVRLTPIPQSTNFLLSEHALHGAELQLVVVY